MERLCFIEREENVKIWTERDLLLLLDHYNRPDYRSGPTRAFKDVELLKKEVKEKVSYLTFNLNENSDHGLLSAGIYEQTIL